MNQDNNGFNNQNNMDINNNPNMTPNNNIQPQNIATVRKINNDCNTNLQNPSPIIKRRLFFFIVSYDSKTVLKISFIFFNK